MSGFKSSDGPCGDCWVEENRPPPVCHTCQDGDIVRSANYILQRQIAIQKKIWGVSRVGSSEFSMNKAVQNVTGDVNNEPKAINGNVNWNQSSDRAVAGVSRIHTSRRATRHRPGGSGAGGVGVDVKHNSYDRYLARKKSGNLKTKMPAVLPVAKKGNKQFSLGFINRCNC
uniref:Uncharacterized protein n=1 Tax=viral metagenome TaxID=1070528 RepID=A0A6C0CPP0_9ZZZZ